MNLATACSGIGAPEVAAFALGWRVVWCSEVARFASRVLAAHHPEAPNLGDMEAIANGSKPLPADRVDVLCAGTPCQSFSLAGLRRGLDDSRGNLTLAFLRVVGRVRPPWVVWENVPGVLSSGGGRDFGAFLGGLGDLGYGWVYRVLDAQFFGVAQQRRRLFVVGCPGGAWQRAAAVLFEPEGLRGHSPPRRRSREGVAYTPGAGSPGKGWSGRLDRCGAFVPETARALSTREGRRMDPNGETFVVDLAQMTSATNRSTARAGGPVPTIPAQGGGRLTASHLAQDPISGPVSPALGTTTQGMGVMEGASVRRLMPVECERLQGLPDGHTDIPDAEGRPASDSARHYAIGNSMATPVLHWIFRRIQHVHEGTR